MGGLPSSGLESASSRTGSGGASRSPGHWRATPILVLDEINSSVDPEARQELANTLREISREKTVICATHSVLDVIYIFGESAENVPEPPPVEEVEREALQMLEEARPQWEHEPLPDPRRKVLAEERHYAVQESQAQVLGGRGLRL